MSDATFANALNLRRMTIGVTAPGGKRAEIVLEKTADAPFAPLAPVLDALPEPVPAESTVTDMFLCAHGWTLFRSLDWMSLKIWTCPVTQLHFSTDSAALIQQARALGYGENLTLDAGDAEMVTHARMVEGLARCAITSPYVYPAVCAVCGQYRTVDPYFTPDVRCHCEAC